ncbi:disulfide bond formation protein B [Tautonia plasticadhaerens]|uniref:Putative disulfide oxidoreductase n=1 Tax=Tautonia plasticadhaerens TaxID=2527974 RepID=A0A518H170_9BACT|nr:disulfide bond formation protein B [Tautonia plasticadhaerens]QDV34595.1 putative disulfide oxidoreductase [Tautonia plasticadhaerens]
MESLSSPQRTPAWLVAALVVGVAASVGSVLLSVGMGLRACPLCFYQRTFVFSMTAVLGVGLALRREVRPGALARLALPLAVAGLGVAGFHVSLEWRGILECPAGLLGLGTVPLQSLLAHLLLAGLLVVGAARGPEGRPSALAVALLVALGLVLAFACVRSAPPLPPPNPTYGPDGGRILLGCEPAVTP